MTSVRSNGGRQLDPGLAGRLLAELSDRSPDLRAAAVLTEDGAQIAATDDQDWSAGTAALWRAADQRAGDPAGQVHVGTEEGEVFSVRADGAVAVATSDRFALASLMLCDLRALLRELGAASAG